MARSGLRRLTTRTHWLLDGEPIPFEGTAVSLHEVGPAESHADSYLLVRFPRGHPVAFIGDLAFHGTHPFTADGHSGAWLAALNFLTDRLAEVRVLYPGHGEPAGLQVLADQRRYLLYYREMVHRLAEGEPELSEAAKHELYSFSAGVPTRRPPNLDGRPWRRRRGRRARL